VEECYRSFFYILLNWSFPYSFWERGDFSVNKSEGRRSRLDVVADILNFASRGVKKTHLMYHCNMSFMQLKKYLDLTLKAGLIQVQDGNPNLLFRISGKGRRFLKVYESLKGLME